VILQISLPCGSQRLPLFRLGELAEFDDKKPLRKDCVNFQVKEL